MSFSQLFYQRLQATVQYVGVYNCKCVCLCIQVKRKCMARRYCYACICLVHTSINKQYLFFISLLTKQLVSAVRGTNTTERSHIYGKLRFQWNATPMPPPLPPAAAFEIEEVDEGKHKVARRWQREGNNKHAYSGTHTNIYTVI